MISAFDIVKRLREKADFYRWRDTLQPGRAGMRRTPSGVEADEAADEIERQRAESEKLRLDFDAEREIATSALVPGCRVVEDGER